MSSDPATPNRALRAGLALLALHSVLLFLPKIPPIYKRMSVVSYVLSIVAVTLATVGVKRIAPWLVARWRGRAGPGIRIGCAAATVAVLLAALAVRAAASETFARLSLEDGLWETFTLLSYTAGWAVVWATAEGCPASERRARRAVAAGFALLALEEVDYFGIFGGMIGRIDGVYAGSLHDVIRLVAEGVMGPLALALFVAAIAVAVAVAWRKGWFVPTRVAKLVAGPEIVWGVVGMAILIVAASEEAHLFGWVAAQPTPEEAIELTGGIALAIWAVELAARLPMADAARNSQDR